MEKLRKEVALLEMKLTQSQEEKREAEVNMMQAAEFGKELLDKNQELTKKVDFIEQEKHEIQMMLQGKLQMEKSLSTELDIARENVKMLEDEKEQKMVQEDEMLGKKEEMWRGRIAELESTIQYMEAKETGLKNRLEIADKQLEDANAMLNQSVAGMSFSEETADLQQENLALIQKKQVLEVELASLKSGLEQEKVVSRGAQAKIEMLQQELEEVQCQITGYVRAVETSREEVIELEAQMEAMRAGQVEVDGKGNSLFSEVEDRRCIVESQLAGLQGKYDTIKAQFDGKVNQLAKVKMHNAQLLNIAGTRGDSGHASRLEELLAAEREKNKVLADRLDSLEVIRPVNVGVVRVEGGGSGEGVKQHTASEEYNYLTSLLAETQTKNEELQTQMHQQLRQNLKDSDKVREMSRKVHTAEMNLSKMKADHYLLKIALENAKGGVAKQEVKKEPKKIVEMIKFDKKEKPKESESKKEEFILKETVIKAKASPPTDKQATKVIRENKENLETPDAEKSEKPRKKSACFKETVEEIDTEGQSESGQLQGEQKDKIKPAKPLGKKRFGGSQNTVKVTDEQPECKQQ